MKDRLKIIGQCKHCGSDQYLYQTWPEPIWANFYCNDPAGHELAGPEPKQKEEGARQYEKQHI